jgi:sulfide:quinone oxidoreductase
MTSSPFRVVVLGAGFGGLEVTSRLFARFADAVDVVMIDAADAFVFGFSKLDVMFGRVAAEHVMHRYRDMPARPGVRFVQTVIRSIDPATKRVTTDAGEFAADALVVALGADVDPAATPGLLAGGHEFYTVAGAFAARDAIAGFEGGEVVIAVTSTPFKCPPAPSETALLMHEFLRAAGLRERSSISLVMPLPRPVPPSPAASDALLEAFAERGIAWLPERTVGALDPERRVALLADGSELGYDLFLGVPRHHAPEVVRAAGLTEDGWVAVDPLTLQTRYRDVYAIGDVTSVGTPKAGVFAEGQAAVVADRIAATIEGAAGPEYDGRGVCYVEFGDDTVGRVDVTFRAGQPPVGAFDTPSPAWTADKVEFGRSRVARWFGLDWDPPTVGRPSPG